MSRDWKKLNEEIEAEVEDRLSSLAKLADELAVIGYGRPKSAEIVKQIQMLLDDVESYRKERIKLFIGEEYLGM